MTMKRDDRRCLQEKMQRLYASMKQQDEAALALRRRIVKKRRSFSALVEESHILSVRGLNVFYISYKRFARNKNIRRKLSERRGCYVLPRRSFRFRFYEDANSQEKIMYPGTQKWRIPECIVSLLSPTPST